MEYVDTLFRFVVDNNIIGSLAGVTLGFVISTAVKSLVSDILMPSVYKFLYLLLSVTPLNGTALLTRFFQVTELNPDKFIKEAVNLLLIMVCAYLFFIHVLAKYIAEKQQRTAAALSAPAVAPLTSQLRPAMHAHAMYPGLRARPHGTHHGHLIDDGSAAAIVVDGDMAAADA